jgi:hypothetical protein
MVSPAIVLLLGSSLLMAGLQTSLKAAEQNSVILTAWLTSESAI